MFQLDPFSALLCDGPNDCAGRVWGMGTEQVTCLIWCGCWKVSKWKQQVVLHCSQCMYHISNLAELLCRLGK